MKGTENLPEDKKKELIESILKSLEAEFVVSQFYNFLVHNAKSKDTASIFIKLENDSKEHRKVLEEEFRRLVGHSSQTVLSKFEPGARGPQSFTLTGAIKTMLNTENKVYRFYKTAARDGEPRTRRIFKKLAADESRHFRALKRGLDKIEEQEEFTSLRVLDFDRWLHQFWK